jgi:ATP-dependent Clp protease ATP-binding subunit ClpX
MARKKSKTKKRSKKKSPFPGLSRTITPNEILSVLDKHIIGQDEAKRALSIFVSNHVTRVLHPESQHITNNLMVIGPSGSGKTEMCRVIERELKIPIVVADCSSFSPSGYKGNDVSTVIIQAIGTFGPDYGEEAIIFLDEIDKVLIPSARDTEDFKSQGVQSELLKMTEGGEVLIDNENVGTFTVDTSKMSFIFGGTFVGLEAIVRNGTGTKIGFNSDYSIKSKDVDWTKSFTTDKLVQLGIMAELAGRISNVAFTKELTQEELVRTMTEKEISLLTQYTKLFSIHGVDLRFERGFAEHVAAKAVQLKLGVRGTKTIIEESIKPIYFKLKEYESKTVYVSDNGVRVESRVSAPVVSIKTKLNKRSNYRKKVRG